MMNTEVKQTQECGKVVKAILMAVVFISCIILCLVFILPVKGGEVWGNSPKVEEDARAGYVFFGGHGVNIMEEPLKGFIEVASISGYELFDRDMGELVGPNSSTLLMSNKIQYDKDNADSWFQVIASVNNTTDKECELGDTMISLAVFVTDTTGKEVTSPDELSTPPIYIGDRAYTLNELTEKENLPVNYNYESPSGIKYAMHIEELSGKHYASAFILAK